jgi:hypothetical protein
MDKRRFLPSQQTKNLGNYSNLDKEITIRTFSSLKASKIREIFRTSIEGAKKELFPTQRLKNSGNILNLDQGITKRTFSSLKLKNSGYFSNLEQKKTKGAFFLLNGPKVQEIDKPPKKY